MTINVNLLQKEGDFIDQNQSIIELNGYKGSILQYERTLLNLLNYMSAIATKTYYLKKLLKETSIQILDTRKTLPHYRALSKYSVWVAGGKNHRYGLFDMYMIKDNHIKSAGSISSAIRKVKKHKKQYQLSALIEIECKTIFEVKEAVLSKPDIIMLDNMSFTDVQKSISYIPKSIKIELSGNFNEQKILEFRPLNIDYISIGELTHSPALIDLSLDFAK